MTMLVERLKDVLSSLFAGPGGPERVALPELTGQSGFKALPHGRWVAWWSNNFEDRQKELFTQAAIDAYVARLDEGRIPQPELWLWHEPVVMGQAEWTERIGHLMVSVGHFASTDVGVRACGYYTNSKESHAMSHGYLYPPSALVDGQYHAFNTFEISVLPPHAAANPYTAFETVYEEVSHMALNEEKKALLDQVLGKDLADKIVQGAQQRSKALEELGVRFKDVGSDSPASPAAGGAGAESTPAGDEVAEPTPTPTATPAAAPVSAPAEVKPDAPAVPEVPEVKALGGVDEEARAAIKALVESNAEANGTVAAALKALAGQLEAVIADNRAKSKQVDDLTAYVKAQFELQPSPTLSPSTVVPDNNPYVQFLKQQQLGTKAPQTLFGEVMKLFDGKVG